MSHERPKKAKTDAEKQPEVPTAFAAALAAPGKLNERGRKIGKSGKKMKPARAATVESTAAESAPVESAPAPAPAKEAFKSEAIAPETDGTFNPNTLSGRVQDAYLGYVKKFKDRRIKPEEMPADAWETMYKAIETSKKLARQYSREFNPQKKKAIASRLQHLAETVESGKIGQMLDKAADNTAVKAQNKKEAARNAYGELVSETLRNLPKSEPAPEKSNPWEVYGGQLANMENALRARYPEGEGVPPEVLEKYTSLTRTQMGNIEEGDKTKIEETAAAVESFLRELAPTPEDRGKDVDTKSFQAPQYGQRGLGKKRRDMQKEMDTLVESAAAPEQPEAPTPPEAAVVPPAPEEPLPEILPGAGEPLPAVFRSNRARAEEGRAEAEELIPTLTDVVEPSEHKPEPPTEGAKRSDSFEVKPEKGEDGLEYINIIPVSASGERTPGETRGVLKNLVERLTNMTGAISERFTASKNSLNERAKEIDGEAAKMGGIEKAFRSLGKKYDELSLIHKLGFGVTLGVGTAVGAAFSLPLALAGVAGLVAQRVVGAASMFLRIEKDLQTKKVGEKSNQFISRKERAMLDAALYTAVMGVAINQALELAREYNVVERTREWLGGMLGHHAAEPETATPIRPITGAPAPEVSHVPPPATETAPAPAAEAVAVDSTIDELPSDEAAAEGIVPPDTAAAALEDQEAVPAQEEPPAEEAAAEGIVPPDTSTAALEDQEIVPAQEETPAYPPLEEVKLVSPEPLQEANMAQAHEIITNHFGLEVPTAEAHLYADAGAKQVLVFGGSHAERMDAMLHYLKENPAQEVYGADPSGKYRVPWHLVDGEVTPAGMPVRTGGFLGTGFGSTEMKPPGPEEFAKIIR